MASFLDANIFMYAAGQEHPHKEPSLKLLEHVVDPSAARQEGFFSNTEVLQELLHRYRSLGRADLADRVFRYVVSLPITFLPVSLDDMFEAQRLLNEYPELSTRDAVHAGCMRRATISRIYSYDREFSKLSFLERLEPQLR